MGRLIFYVILYLFSLLVFLGIDFLWIGVVAKNFYQQKIGHLFAEQTNFVPALIFYMLNVVGIIIFVINPAMERQSVAHAALYGALYGFFMYAAYDLTNHATLKDWPLSMTVVDMAWGTVITAVVASVGYLIGTKLL